MASQTAKRQVHAIVRTCVLARVMAIRCAAAAYIALGSVTKPIFDKPADCAADNSLATRS